MIAQHIMTASLKLITANWKIRYVHNNFNDLIFLISTSLLLFLRS
jgi:hypothetical protein